MEAAARAASVASDTAIPQSAFFSAGASFTPSPVMPTMCPCFCRTSTIWNLCSGNTWAKPSAFSIDSATSALSCFFASPKLEASRILVPMSSFLAVSFAMASASPVTILILTPIVSAVAMVDLASSRGGSNRGNTPTNCHGPSPSARATPSERKPRAAKSSTAFSTALFTCADIGRQLQDHLRRALRHLEGLAVLAFDARLGALVHRIEGLEMQYLIGL